MFMEFPNFKNFLTNYDSMFVNTCGPYKTVTEVIKKIGNAVPLLNRMHVACIVWVQSLYPRGSGRKKT